MRDGQKTEQMLRYLVESVVDYAIFMLDTKGYVTSWNVGAQRIKGYSASEIIGQHFSRFYLPEEIAAGKCEMELERAAALGRFEDEGWRVRKDGTMLWANVVISAMRDESGKLLGYAKVTRDLTARRRAEDDRAARLAAEEASRAKDEFLAMLGHELRNPLAPIATAVELMQQHSNVAGSRELEIIERQVTHMRRLIDDLLDASRVTRGKISLDRRRFDVAALVAKAVEVASPLLEQHRHHLRVDVGAGLVVDGDEARLTQVFSNLLVNAAKYTPPGGHIVVRGVRDGDDVVVEVEDDGQGIASDVLPRVFDLFFQGEQSMERPAGGLGIGLRLVHSLVELHGGSVSASSAGPGKGSTFSVRLPRVAGPADQPRQPERRIAPASHGVSILVVDDNEDALELLAKVLQHGGHDVVTATDGIQGLRIAAEITPDVVILDIGLPMMDGYEVAQRMRALLGERARLIALTGYGQASDVERGRAAGFDQHLVKPVDTTQLLAQLRAPH